MQGCSVPRRGFASSHPCGEGTLWNAVHNTPWPLASPSQTSLVPWALLPNTKYWEPGHKAFVKDFLKLEWKFHAFKSFDGSVIICWGVSLPFLGLELNLEFCFPVYLVGSEFSNPPQNQCKCSHWTVAARRRGGCSICSLSLNTPCWVWLLLF